MTAGTAIGLALIACILVMLWMEARDGHPDPWDFGGGW